MSNRDEQQVLTQVRPHKLDDFNLLIVDEASMADKKEKPKDPVGLMDYIRDTGIRVLWLGDSEQLPPINKAKSPVFGEPMTSYHLTEVVRQGGELLEFIRAIRGENWIATKPFPLQTSAVIDLIKPRNLAARMFEPEVFDKFIAGQAKYIAYTNAKVDSVNAMIRAHRFGEDVAKRYAYCPGDHILFKSPFMVDQGVPLESQDLQTFFKSKRYGTLITTNSKAEVIRVTDASLWTVPCYKLELRLDGKVDKLILTPTAEGEARLKAILNAIASDAKKASGYGRAKQWELFHAVKSAFADLKHAYAWTGHRSQGSTIPWVFADVDNLLANSLAVVGKKNFYVACSRAKERLTLVTNRSK
jgi:hypothetical protein